MNKKPIDPIICFKFLIENYEQYSKFIQPEIFSMLPSVVEETGVTNKLEELRILFTRFRADYGKFPEVLSSELEELYIKLQDDKQIKELAPDHLIQYFSIDVHKMDQKLTQERVNEWFEFVWLIFKVKTSFGLAKEKETVKEKIQTLRKELNDGLNWEIEQDARLEGLLFQKESYERSEDILLKTGYQSLDAMLSTSGNAKDGGFTRGGLYVFMAPPKGGKSLILSNLMAQAVKLGHNIAIASFEMTKSDYFERLNTNLFGIPRKLYSREIMMEQLDNVPKNWGQVFFKQFTNAHTPHDVTRWMLKIQTAHSVKLDLAFVDYVNIMANARGTKSEQTYVAVKQNCEDLRSAGLRHDWVTVTATQSNRAGANVEQLEMEHVSESYGLSATADALFGIDKQFNIPDQRSIRTIISRRSGAVHPIFFSIDWAQWKIREIANFAAETESPFALPESNKLI